jgi:Tfp pilus assembly protein PilO
MDLSELKKSKFANTLYLLRNEKNRKYFIIGLTFFMSIFFLLFAINPTLSTIAGLNKQLEDLKFVDNALQTKISNMDRLQERYQVLESDLGLVTDAIPKEPDSVTLTGQIQQAAASSNVTLFSVTLSDINFENSGSAPQTYPISIAVQGSYSNISTFLDKLFTMQRIITFDSISIDKNVQNGELTCSIKAIAYFNK